MSITLTAVLQYNVLYLNNIDLNITHTQISDLVLSYAVVSEVYFIPIATRSKDECGVKTLVSSPFHL